MFGSVWPTTTTKSNPLSKNDGITTSLCTGSAEAMVYVTYNDKERPNKSSRRLGRWRSQRDRPRRFVVKKLDSEVEWGEEGKEREPEEEESRDTTSSQLVENDNEEAVHVSNENNCQVVTKSVVLGKGVTLTLTLTVSNEDKDEPVGVVATTANTATKENTPPVTTGPAFDEWPTPLNAVKNINNNDDIKDDIKDAIAPTSQMTERTEDYDLDELDLDELAFLAIAMEDNYRDDLKELNEGKILLDGKEMDFDNAKSHSLLLENPELQQQQQEKVETEEANDSAENEAEKAISPEEAVVAVAKAPSDVEGTPLQAEKVEGEVVHVNAIKLVDNSNFSNETEAAVTTPKAHNVVSSVEYDTEGMVWTDGPSDTKDDSKMPAAEAEVAQVVTSHVIYDTEDMVWTDGPNLIRPATTMDNSEKDGTGPQIGSSKKDSWSDLPDENTNISPPSLDDMDSQELGAMALLGAEAEAEAEVEANNTQDAGETKVAVVYDDNLSDAKEEETPVVAAVVAAVVPDLPSEDEGGNFNNVSCGASSAAAACQIDQKEKQYTSDGETIVSKMAYTWSNVLGKTNNDLPLDIEFGDGISIADSEISCWTEKRDAARKAKEEQEKKKNETIGGFLNFKDDADEEAFRRLQDMAGCEVASESSSEDEESIDSDDDFSC